MESHDEPIPNKRRGEISLKSVRVKKLDQTHQIMGVLMELTT